MFCWLWTPASLLKREPGGNASARVSALWQELQPLATPKTRAAWQTASSGRKSMCICVCSVCLCMCVHVCGSAENITLHGWIILMCMFRKCVCTHTCMYAWRCGSQRKSSGVILRNVTERPCLPHGLAHINWSLRVDQKTSVTHLYRPGITREHHNKCVLMGSGDNTQVPLLMEMSTLPSKLSY